MALVPSFTRQDVEVLNDSTVYDGFFQIRIFELRHRLFAGEWSQPIRRERFERRQAAAVLLYDAQQDAVVLTQQFRIGALECKSPWLFELVAGIVEAGESAEDVAVREAQEESGAHIQHLLPICEYWVSPGGTNESVALFCASVDSQELGGIHGLEAEDEDIQVHVVSRTDAVHALTSGAINNAATIMALQWLELNLAKTRALFESSSTHGDLHNEK